MATRAITRSQPPTILQFDTRSNMVNGKRKSMITKQLGIDEDEPDKKKRKPATKKQSIFKPLPVPITNSSDTPPDDNDEDLHLLPPPPERKIARRRESTREIRERQESPIPIHTNQQSSTSSSNSSKRIKISAEDIRGRAKSIDPIRSAVNTSDDPLGGIEETESMGSNRRVQVEGLSIPLLQASRPSGPRPTSPPRRTFSSSHSSQPIAGPGPSTAQMGPPPTSSKGLVRKTRQSMGRTKGRISELSKESFVPLMESETPVIRKNQQLRGQQARRSSLDHRGSRASSSWGKGEITMPHKNVDSKLFYRHIPVSYPEPIKARMLLVWCANRALEESLKPPSTSSRRDKGKGKAKAEIQEEGRTEEGDKMLREIMDEFVREMNRGGVDTSVFGAPGRQPTVTGLRPHPKNVSNRKVEAAANADIRKYKGEEAQWHALASSTRAKQEDVISRLKKKAEMDSEPDMSTSEDWMKDALDLAQGILDRSDDDMLQSKGEFEDVEFKIDTLHQTSHVALQYVLQSSRFLDGIFSSLTADLRSRDRLGLPPINNVPDNDEEGPDTIGLLSTATRSASSSSSSINNNRENKNQKKVDPMVLLRALALKESKIQNEKLIERAMQIPPVTLTSSSSTTTATTTNNASNVIGSATPGRQNTLGNSTTPRRPTGLTGQTPRTARRGMTPHGQHD
ncbi:uncharacterized protein L199_006668 [Kwoniella botswanensis]|uniref:uncharacterized protein n=1 Tax=Kwoniella botswanensis TaxID=1268659 RepID=UPI00315D2121